MITYSTIRTDGGLTNLDRIDNILKELKSGFKAMPELLPVLQDKLRIDWTYNSNAIEGNSLTLGETAFFLREGLTAEGKPLKDFLEARSHAEAIDGLFDVVSKKRKMSESLIKELHAVLMKGLDYIYVQGGYGKMVKKAIYPGKYKTLPNHVLTLSGKIHHYTEPIHVNDEMEDLLKWYHKSHTLHPVVKAGIFHFEFVKIHPFNDGNGRIARILMNLVLMQHGYPPCVIKYIHRRDYLTALEQADDGNILPFLTFVLNELLYTVEVMLLVLKNVEHPSSLFNRKDRDKTLIGILKKGNLSIGKVLERAPYMKRATLKSDLKRLSAIKKIRKKGRGKGTTYSSLV